MSVTAPDFLPEDLCEDEKVDTIIEGFSPSRHPNSILAGVITFHDQTNNIRAVGVPKGVWESTGLNQNEIIGRKVVLTIKRKLREHAADPLGRDKFIITISDITFITEVKISDVDTSLVPPEKEHQVLPTTPTRPESEQVRQDAMAAIAELSFPDQEWLTEDGHALNVSFRVNNKPFGAALSVDIVAIPEGFPDQKMSTSIYLNHLSDGSDAPTRDSRARVLKGELALNIADISPVSNPKRLNKIGWSWDFSAQVIEWAKVNIPKSFGIKRIRALALESSVSAEILNNAGFRNEPNKSQSFVYDQE